MTIFSLDLSKASMTEMDEIVGVQVIDARGKPIGVPVTLTHDGARPVPTPFDVKTGVAKEHVEGICAYQARAAIALATGRPVEGKVERVEEGSRTPAFRVVPRRRRTTIGSALPDADPIL